MRKTVLLLAATAFAGVAIAAPASANTTVMGSALTLPYQGGVCNNNCLAVQVSQAGGNSPNPLISPANGAVTSWAVRTGDPGAIYRLRILTPGANNGYIGTASISAPAAVPAGTTDSIITYPVPAVTTVPIKVGQAIGLLQGNGATAGLPQNTTDGVTTNVIATSKDFNGSFSDQLGATLVPEAPHELLLQATIKFCKVPNLVGEPLSAAHSALPAADCGAATVVRKPVGKKKNRGKILSTDPAAGATVAPVASAVKVTIGVKKKKKKK